MNKWVVKELRAVFQKLLEYSSKKHKILSLDSFMNKVCANNRKMTSDRKRFSSQTSNKTVRSSSTSF